LEEAVHIIVRPFIYAKIRDFTNSANDYSSSIRKIWITTIACQIGYIVGASVFYLIINASVTIDPIWVTALTTKCTHHNMNGLFQYRSYVDLGVFSGVFGTFAGILLDYTVFRGNIEKFEYGSIKNASISFVLNIIIGGVIMLPYALISTANQLFLQFVFKSTVPAILLGLYLGGGSNYLFKRLGLLRRGHSKVTDEDEPTIFVEIP